MAHPESNGQAEATNKAILNTLKRKIEGKKGAWAQKISVILWSYKVTRKEIRRETPFCMAYEAEAVIP